MPCASVLGKSYASHHKHLRDGTMAWNFLGFGLPLLSRDKTSSGQATQRVPAAQPEQWNMKYTQYLDVKLHRRFHNHRESPYMHAFPRRAQQWRLP